MESRRPGADAATDLRTRSPPARCSCSESMSIVRAVIGCADRWQRQHRVGGIPYAVVKKFGDDSANLLVVSLAWYGFTAIFPLLLVVVTVFEVHRPEVDRHQHPGH